MSLDFIINAERALMVGVRAWLTASQGRTIIEPVDERPYARPGRDADVRYQAPPRVLSQTQLTQGVDTLRIVACSAVAAVWTVTGLIQQSDGQLAAIGSGGQGFTIQGILGDRVARIFDLNIGPNASIVSINVASNAVGGPQFAIIQSARLMPSGLVVVTGTKSANYLTNTQGVSWPGTPITTSTNGEPVVRDIVGTVPALGGLVHEVCPPGARWELVTMFCQLVSGPAATRNVAMQINYGGNPAIITECPTAQGAAQTVAYTFGQAMLNQSINGFVTVPFPPRQFLRAGDEIFVTATPLPAGDQFITIFYQVREWLDF